MSPPPNAQEPEEAYLARPNDWKPDKRRVYNYRKIIFRNPPYLASPAHSVEKALKMAFALSSKGGTEDRNLWIEFLNEISNFQIINITELPTKEKTAILLNLYHLMVLHGMIILGPPSAWSSWPSFYNTVVYLFNFDTISISEMEYNVIRYL